MTSPPRLACLPLFLVACLALFTPAGASADPLVPACADVAVSTAEDVPLQVRSGCPAGPDQQLLTPPTHGTATWHVDEAGAGAWTYVPALNYAGSDSFVVSTPDASRPGLVTVTVTAVDDAPICGVPPVATTAEDVVRAISFGAAGCTDVDGPITTYVIDTLPAHGTLGNGTTARNYLPAANYYGADSITFHAPGGPLIVQQIVVTSVNDAPACATLTVPAVEETRLVGHMTCTDAEGDAILYVRDVDVAHGTLGLLGGADFEYMPVVNFAGNDSFQFHAVDSFGASSVRRALTIAVANVDDAPSCTGGGAATLAEDATVTLLPRCTDPDGPAPTLQVVTNVAHGVLQAGGVQLGSGTFVYRPAANFNGADVAVVRATDGTTTTDPVAFQITVTPVNDVPACTGGGAVTVLEDTPTASLPMGCTDADGDTLAYQVVTPPAHGTLVGSGVPSYRPAPEYHGADVVSLRATDGVATSTSRTFSLTVASVNDAPVCAAPATVQVEEDGSTPVDLAPACSDVDGDALTWSIDAQPNRGVLTGTGASRTYTTLADENGADSFSFHASDGLLASSVVAQAVDIQPVNDAPTCSGPTSLATPGGTAIAASFRCLDVDAGTTLSYELVQPQHGTVTVDGTTVVYAPAIGFAGLDTYSFRALDGVTASGAVSVAVTVRASATPDPTPTPTPTPTPPPAPDPAPVVTDPVVPPAAAPATVATPTPAPTQPPAPTVPDSEAPTSSLLTLVARLTARQRLRTVLAHGLTGVATCAQRCRLTESVTISPRVAAALHMSSHGRSVTIGLATNPAAAAGSVRFTVPLTRTARAKLRTARTLNATLTVVAVGSDGATVRRTVPVVLR